MTMKARYGDPAVLILGGRRTIGMVRTKEFNLMTGVCNHSPDSDNWEQDGGRPCPYDNGNCSQPVYICAVCGDIDYGYVASERECNKCKGNP